MTSAEWARIQRLFDRALDLEASQREAFVRREAGDDEELAAAVLRLLEHDAAAPQDFIEPPLLEGEKVAKGRRVGDFEIYEELGRGRMGVVYRGLQPSLGREVAIKVLSGALSTTASRVERFHREARAVAKLTHPNIIRVYAVGSDAGMHWFAMELVAGHDLETDIELATRDQTRRDPETTQRDGVPILPPVGSAERTRAIAELVARIADGLAHAHAHGIVHRDIKPSNILLTPDGDLRIADFGIALDASLGTLTETGQVLGSLPYMSPEQALALEQRVDHRTDIYSTGVVLYELLARRRPFGGTTAVEILAKIRKGQPTPLRSLDGSLPQDLVTICEKAMRHDADKRYATAADLAEDLRRFLRFESIVARPASFAERTLEKLRVHRGLLASASLTVVAMLVGAWWMRQSAVADEQRAKIDFLQRIAAVGGLDDVSVPELHRARRVSTELAAESTDPKALDVAARVAKRIDDYAHELEVSAELALASAPATDLVLQSVWDAVHGLVRHAEIVGSDARGAVQRIKARLIVTSTAGFVAGSKFTVAYMDAQTGQPGKPVAEGVLPMQELTLPAGLVRIRVDGPEQAPREFSRELRSASLTRLEFTARNDSDPWGDMVRVEGGAFTKNPLRGDEDLDQPWQVATFWLDAYEVTIGEYRAFLEAMGPEYPRSRYWKDMASGAHDDLPVCHVTWTEARDYAEWRGKRLPTILEWTWAARGGNERRRYPWQGDAWPDCYPLEGRPINIYEAARLDRHLARLRPVRSHPETASVSPPGIHWLLGNVAEFTETPVLEDGTDKNGTGDYFRLLSRFVAGHGWDVRAVGPDLMASMKVDIGSANRRLDVGFRCARSVK